MCVRGVEHNQYVQNPKFSYTRLFLTTDYSKQLFAFLVRKVRRLLPLILLASCHFTS